MDLDRGCRRGVLDGAKLTIEDYERVEAAYVKAFVGFAQDSNVEQLQVRSADLGGGWLPRARSLEYTRRPMLFDGCCARRSSASWKHRRTTSRSTLVSTFTCMSGRRARALTPSSALTNSVSSSRITGHHHSYPTTSDVRGRPENRVASSSHAWWRASQRAPHRRSCRKLPLHRRQD